MLKSALLCTVVAILSNPAASAQLTSRVSVDSLGIEANEISHGSSIAADGRFVAFMSEADNLVPGDTNNARDVFVHDTLTGTTERVSVGLGGAEANGQSSTGLYSTISADGRYVVFHSEADNLVVGDTNGREDVFLHDRWTGMTSLVSVPLFGPQGAGDSQSPSISSDGSTVVFQSSASNLVPGDTNGHVDIFVRDLSSSTTSRVSIASQNLQGNDDSFFPSLSADGSVVVFVSSASNLVSGDTNGTLDIFFHDRNTGLTSRASIGTGGVQANDWSNLPRVSGDGRLVSFMSYATNLVPGDTNDTSDVFVHDRMSASTTRVSVSSVGVQGNRPSSFSSISADGRYVAFESQADDLVPGDANVHADIFVRDTLLGTTSLLSVNSWGTQANGQCNMVSLSEDGRYLSFQSLADNLVPHDTNGKLDVFVVDSGHPGIRSLSVHPDSLSASTGAQITFSIDFEGAYSGVKYKALGSTLGTGPTSVAGIDIPLTNGNWLWDAMMAFPGPSQFQGNNGFLDANGDAAAILTWSPGAGTQLVGRTLFFAVALYVPATYSGIKASNHVLLTILP